MPDDDRDDTYLSGYGGRQLFKGMLAHEDEFHPSKEASMKSLGQRFGRIGGMGDRPANMNKISRMQSNWSFGRGGRR